MRPSTTSYARREQGRVRAGRRGEPAGDPDRHRLGSLAVRGCEEAARRRRHPRARGEHAELGDLRRAVGGVQGERAAGRRAEAGGGSRLATGLVEVCGPGRRCDRAGSLWRSAPGHRAGEAWIHGAECRGAGEEAGEAGSRVRQWPGSQASSETCWIASTVPDPKGVREASHQCRPCRVFLEGGGARVS